MGFSLETTNYKLGQYAGTDKPNYTTDYNENMAKIDAALKAVSDAGGATNTDLGDTKDRVSALETNVAKNTEDIASVTAAAEQNARDIVSANSEIEALQTKATEFDGNLETANNNIATANSEIEALQTKDTELEGDVTNVKNQLTVLPTFDGLSTNTLKMETITLTYTTGIAVSPKKQSIFTIPANELPGLGMMDNAGFIPINCTVVNVTATQVRTSDIKVLGIMPQQSSPSVPSKLLNVAIFNTTEHGDNITSISIAVKGISVSLTN